MKLEQIKKYILEKRPYQVVVLRRKSNVLLMNTGSDTHEGMIEQLDELAKDEPGTYSVHIKLMRNHPNTRILEYESVLFGIHQNQTEQIVHTPKVNEAAIRKQLEEDFRRQKSLEAQKQEQVRLTNELKAKIAEVDKIKAELNTAGGRVGYMLETVIKSKFMSQAQSMAQPLNSGQGNVQLNVQGQESQEDLNKRIHQSVLKILTVVTPDQLELFAETLSKNPGLVQTLLTLAKSYS